MKFKNEASRYTILQRNTYNTPHTLYFPHILKYMYI